MQRFFDKPKIGVAVQIQVLQHVPFEGPAAIATWARERGHSVAKTRLFAGEALPVLDQVDVLVVMGGPMGVADHADYPWLAEESVFIRSVIEAQRPVLGICLGAQLIAKSLSAPVSRNAEREIGWFPLVLDEAIKEHWLAEVIADGLEVLHWHGDTFAVPAGALPIASTQACRNQGFILDDRVIALQFHLEATELSARDLVEHCREELDGSAFVQDEHSIVDQPRKFARVNEVLYSLLDRWLAKLP